MSRVNSSSRHLNIDLVHSIKVGRLPYLVHSIKFGLLAYLVHSIKLDHFTCSLHSVQFGFYSVYFHSFMSSFNTNYAHLYFAFDSRYLYLLFVCMDVILVMETHSALAEWSRRILYVPRYLSYLMQVFPDWSGCYFTIMLESDRVFFLECLEILEIIEGAEDSPVVVFYFFVVS